MNRTFLACAVTASLAATLFSPALATAQSSSSGSSSQNTPSTPSTPTKWADSISEELTVVLVGDLLGKGISDNAGFYSGDLGIMTDLGPGDEFVIIFGDSFRGYSLGDGEWMSPVGVVARMGADGKIEILRPLNRDEQVQQLLNYTHNDRGLTHLPSDIITIDDTMYMQTMANEGVGNVLYTEIWQSTDSGATWTSVARTPRTYLNGMGNLISWEQGPDGYIYVVSSEFQRKDPVYLSRFQVENIADRTKWEVYDPQTDQWGKSGSPILDQNVAAGEMNLRYIQGHWVLAMFNRETMAIEIRISEDIARDWNEITPANVVISGTGGWAAEQTPSNFTQLYGGYITPTSTLDNMDIVVSQWNTSDNSRYNSTQFNIKGLGTFFGIDTTAPQSRTFTLQQQPQATGNQSDIQVTEVPVDPDVQQTLTQDMLLEDGGKTEIIPLEP
ncbi:DUF4185 domain-containing protein [Corynebacterium sp. S7]